MDLYIAQSEGKGRGVYAARQFRQGELIEICPVIVVPQREVPALYHYYFAWNDAAALCLGYGSLYNHADRPNAAYTKRVEDLAILFHAIRHVAVGEEITINYNSYHPRRKLWFEKK